MQKAPIPIRPVTVSDDLTLYTCAREIFRWVRTGADLVAQAPELAVDVAADLKRAWDDSAKPQ